LFEDNNSKRLDLFQHLAGRRKNNVLLDKPSTSEPIKSLCINACFMAIVIVYICNIKALYARTTSK
jgi:hypothetical protein